MPKFPLIILAATGLLLSACGGSDPAADAAAQLGISEDELQEIGSNIERCDEVAQGTAVVTEADVQSCKDAIITLGFDCNDGNDLVVIGKNDTNIALRVGSAPIDLGEDYTFTDAANACGDPAP